MIPGLLFADFKILDIDGKLFHFGTVGAGGFEQRFEWLYLGIHHAFQAFAHRLQRIALAVEGIARLALAERALGIAHRPAGAAQ